MRKKMKIIGHTIHKIKFANKYANYLKCIPELFNIYSQKRLKSLHNNRSSKNRCK